MRNVLKSVALIMTACTAHAGAMGDIVTPLPQLIPFAGVEAVNNFPYHVPLSINNNFADRSYSNWGARVLGGFIHPYTDVISFSGEMGWASFGGNTQTIPNLGFSAKTSHYGFDMLLGAMYTYQQLDLSVKAGAMLQNAIVTTNADLARVIPGGVFHGNKVSTRSSTGVLPEVKVGGVYNFYNNLGVSLAYAHTFSPGPSISRSSTVVAGNANIDNEVNTRMPPLNLIMFGLQYKFV